MQYIFTSILLVLNVTLLAQNFLEDFETNQLNNWELIEGKADLSDTYIVAGDNSLRLWNFKELESPEAVLLHKTFKEDFGTYSYYAIGDGQASHADFYFHYIDNENYYHVSHKPINTDTPEFKVSKVVNGVYTELYRQEAVEEKGTWIYVSIERFCNGRMIVGVNNDDLLDVIETDILIPGNIGLRSWNEYSFFDRIEFESYAPPTLELDTMICHGQSIQIGQNRIDTTGTYFDTLINLSGCDSIKKINLMLADSIQITLDTVICPASVILIDDQIIDSSGSYRMSYKSIGGCDSIVTWSVSESIEFDLGPDRAFCDDEELIISADEQQTYLWNTGASTHEILIDKEGSYSIEVLDVNNCIQTDTIVIVNQCELTFYAANVFSPNGDMVHDVWKPEFDFQPQSYSLSIYDRWGNMLMHTNDLQDSWDGKFQNNYVAEGVYVWSISADSESFWGDVSVIR